MHNNFNGLDYNRICMMCIILGGYVSLNLDDLPSLQDDLSFIRILTHSLPKATRFLFLPKKNDFFAPNLAPYISGVILLC